jgi:hypothetical protein
MRTTTTKQGTTTALLSLMTAIAGCAQIDGNHNGTRPDGGTTDQTCDSPTNKTMDMTISDGTDMKSIPSGCWNLKGTLTVSGAATSLAKLGDLRSVQNLIINGSSMTTIDTASMLSVTGKLDIEGNTKLTSLANVQLPQDASCLTYLDSMTIKANPALTDLGGAANVLCVSGATVISNNVELTTVKLDQAQRLEGGLEISYNDKLTGLSLGNVQSITHDVIISNNKLLTSFTTLAKLHFMHGSIFIDSNPLLVTLPTEMVTPGPVVELNLTVTNNAALTELGGFTKLLGVNGIINVTNNATLDYCQAQEIGCCVGHNGTALISSGNKNHTCATHPSCWAANGDRCLYSYTN